jgi:hypothetical protein
MVDNSGNIIARPGFTTLADGTVYTDMAEYDGQLYGVSAGSFGRIDTLTAAFSPMTTVTAPMCYVPTTDMLVCSDRVRVFTLVTGVINEAPAVLPPASADVIATDIGGAMPVGSILLQVSYVLADGSESPPTAVVSITHTGGVRVSVDPLTAPAAAIGYMVYMSTSGGSVPLACGSAPLGVPYNVVDDGRGMLTPMRSVTSTPIPPFSTAALHAGMLFLSTGTAIYMSGVYDLLYTSPMRSLVDASTTQVIGAVSDGLYYVDNKEVRFVRMSGDVPTTAIVGRGTLIEGTVIAPDIIIDGSYRIFAMMSDGFCAFAPSGQVYNLTRSSVQFPTSAISGAITYSNVGGSDFAIVTLQ